MSARETQSGGASRRSNLTRPMKNASATLKQIDPAEERELQRGLTNRHLQLIALGGAIGTGMFMGSSSTIHLAGPSSAPHLRADRLLHVLHDACPRRDAALKPPLQVLP